MAFTFKLENRAGYVSMTYEGFYSSSIAEEFTDQVLEVCKTHQPVKLLIDLRQVTGDMSTMERLQLALIAARKYFVGRLQKKIPSCRYAIVGNHPLVDPKKFEETVAVYRGVNVRTFTEIKEALAWLEVEK